MDITELSSNEIYCLTTQGYQPGAYTNANCVHSLGIHGDIVSDTPGAFGKELKEITRFLHQGRQVALHRLHQQAKDQQANLIKLTLHNYTHAGNIEFFASGNLIKKNSETLFSTHLNGQELYALLDTGYQPVTVTVGNTAYSTHQRGGILGKLKSRSDGEDRHLTELFHERRLSTVERIIKNIQSQNYNCILGITSSVTPYKGVNELCMIGTAAYHPIFSTSSAPVTCHLTPVELWNLSQLGYGPVQLLLASKVYSLGFKRTLKSAFKTLDSGEITDLSNLFTAARTDVLNQIDAAAKKINADKVIEIKIFINHFENGIFEVYARGTAIRKFPGLKTQSKELPWQCVT